MKTKYDIDDVIYIPFKVAVILAKEDGIKYQLKKDKVQFLNWRVDESELTDNKETPLDVINRDSDGSYESGGVQLWGDCPICGNTVEENFDYCPYCGQRIKWEE